MLDEKWFVAGLGSFLLGHIAYVVGLQSAPTSVAGTLVGLAVVVARRRPSLGRRIVSGVAQAASTASWSGRWSPTWW